MTLGVLRGARTGGSSPSSWGPAPCIFGTPSHPSKVSEPSSSADDQRLTRSGFHRMADGSPSVSTRRSGYSALRRRTIKHKEGCDDDHCIYVCNRRSGLIVVACPDLACAWCANVGDH